MKAVFFFHDCYSHRCKVWNFSTQAVSYLFYRNAGFSGYAKQNFALLKHFPTLHRTRGATFFWKLRKRTVLWLQMDQLVFLGIEAIIIIPNHGWYDKLHQSCRRCFHINHDLKVASGYKMLFYSIFNVVLQKVVLRSSCEGRQFLFHAKRSR